MTDRLESLLGEVLTELTFARVFITSGQKMHPCGVDLYDDLIGRVKAALDGPSDGEIYAAVSRRDMTPEEEGLIQKALLGSGVAIEQLGAPAQSAPNGDVIDAEKHVLQAIKELHEASIPVPMSLHHAAHALHYAVTSTDGGGK